jgi:hypothetical protein
MQAIDGLLNGIHSATVTDVSVLVREVRVRIGVLTKYVTIRIYDSGNGPDPYTFELSAVMRTAAARQPRQDHSPAATENEALRRAVRSLTQDYEEAVRRGEMPDDGWLVEPPSGRLE